MDFLTNEGWAFSSNYGPWVTIAAPGESIYSTNAVQGDYTTRGGTDGAAATVAGAAVLALAAKGGKGSIAPATLKSYLISTGETKSWLAAIFGRVSSGVSTCCNCAGAGSRMPAHCLCRLQLSCLRVGAIYMASVLCCRTAPTGHGYCMMLPHGALCLGCRFG